MCLFAPVPYYKLNKGFFLGFLFKPLGGLCPPRDLNKKASEKNPLSITCTRETLKRVFLQTAKTQMKCGISSGPALSLKVEKDLQTK